MKGFLSDRDQVYAEAVEMYKAGSPLTIKSEALVIAKSEQDDRYVSDDWEEFIKPYLKDRTVVTSLMILTEVFGLTPEKIDRQKTMRVSAIMRRLGWKRQAVRIDGGAPVKGFKKV